MGAMQVPARACRACAFLAVWLVPRWQAAAHRRHAARRRSSCVRPEHHVAVYLGRRTVADGKSGAYSYREAGGSLHGARLSSSGGCFATGEPSRPAAPPNPRPC